MNTEIARYRESQAKAWLTQKEPHTGEKSPTSANSSGAAPTTEPLGQRETAPAVPKRTFIILDPAGISGCLTLQTPACVLLEVADYWGLAREWGNCEMVSPAVRATLIGQLAALTPVTLSVPLAWKAVKLLAWFVNRALTWGWQELWNAFLELEEQKKEFGADSADDGWDIGCAVPAPAARTENPPPECGCRQKSSRLTLSRLRDMIDGAKISRPVPGKKTVTVSFLYRAAVWLGVPLYPAMDGASLKAAVEGYLGGYGQFLVASLLLKNADSSSAPRCCLPKTPQAAIELAAERLSVDLSFTTDPETAYLELTATGFSREVTELKKRNHRLCELDYVYNPSLRYPKALLKKFRAEFPADSAATDAGRRAAAGAALEAAVVGETFWEGWYPTISNASTLLFDNVADLASDELLCFGSVRKRLWAFSYLEMTQFFRTVQVPSIFTPETGTIQLSPAQIARLKFLLENNSTPSKHELAMELARTTESLMHNERLVSQMFSEYGRGGKLGEGIAAFFECLFVLAMVMRGWSGKKEMPLPVSDAVGVKVDSFTVDLRTGMMIKKLTKLARKVDRGSHVELLQLPLTHYPAGRFERYSSAEGGRTIKERLEILKQPQNTFSCIRLTSNVMAWTALYYMERLGIKLPVKPEEIRSVS